MAEKWRKSEPIYSGERREDEIEIVVLVLLLIRSFW